LTERPDEAQACRAPEFLDANNIEQNKPTFLLPYAPTEPSKKMRLAGPSRPVDESTNRAVGIRIFETRKIPQDAIDVVAIERVDVGRWIGPNALLLNSRTTARKLARSTCIPIARLDLLTQTLEQTDHTTHHGRA
jgi:hypothetical protein